MQLFIQILTKISEIQNVVKDNKDLFQIIAVISSFTVSVSFGAFSKFHLERVPNLILLP